MIPLSAADFLAALAEPTRLRVLNCVDAGPVCVSDVVTILALPQPTVSRHLRVLRDLELVEDRRVAPFVLYTLAPLAGARGRLVRAALAALRTDPALKAEHAAALARRRADAAAAASAS